MIAKIRSNVRLLLAALVLVSIGTGAFTVHAATRPKVCECANLDEPVICSNGHIYPNPCVANCFRATGCVPYP